MTCNVCGGTMYTIRKYILNNVLLAIYLCSKLQCMGENAIYELLSLTMVRERVFLDTLHALSMFM